MKKILSLVAVFALSLSLHVANAQEKPKTASTDKAKSECTTSKDCSSSKAKAACGSSSKKVMKASNKSGDGCCDHGTKAKMASKHDCGDDCGDDCKMAHRMSKSDSNKN
ncbi:MAG: hypothetical protein RRA94_14330 [Bacteroidota bacterium]|nr:hypothetical protein [Bacteroidota bacterium]